MLSAEQIQANLEKFYVIIEKYISEPRTTKLLALYQSQEIIPFIKNNVEFGKEAAQILHLDLSDHCQNGKARVKMKNLLQS